MEKGRQRREAIYTPPKSIERNTSGWSCPPSSSMRGRMNISVSNQCLEPLHVWNSVENCCTASLQGVERLEIMDRTQSFDRMCCLHQANWLHVVTHCWMLWFTNVPSDDAHTGCYFLSQSNMTPPQAVLRPLVVGLFLLWTTRWLTFS